MIWWAALINSIAAGGAVGFAGLALMNPTALCSNATTHRYYPAMYASRSIPLNIMVGILGWLSANPAVVAPSWVSPLSPSFSTPLSAEFTASPE